MPDGYRLAAPDLEEVLAGLSRPQKTLPAKLFYDAEGCRLFGEITQLPEYYVTRTEMALLAQIRSELVRTEGCALVEYGASDEAKALALFEPVGAHAYVPIDVAAEALEELRGRLARSRPALAVYPVTADFLHELDLPDAIADAPKFGFFPGSTIGNLIPAVAVEFLRQVRETLGAGACLLVGVDLQKPLSILLPAYNDAQGVTAAFNRNILAHINREMAADFDLDGFEHRAVWNGEHGRIEMHLVSRWHQVVSVGGVNVVFGEGETIHTENSYKHTIDGFQDMARQAGWAVQQVWTDPDQFYSIHLLKAGIKAG